MSSKNKVTSENVKTTAVKVQCTKMPGDRIFSVLSQQN